MSGCFFSAIKGLKSPFFIGKKGENMTEINLMTNDQRLIAVQRVLIASGDVKSVQLKVAFDSIWDRFTHKSATFHTADNPTKYETLLTDNSCIVPWEVLEKPGTLYIGIIGVDELDIDPLDDPAVKTSSLVSFKIERGAERSITTLTPSLDLFQQYLKAMDNKVDPFRADVYAKMDAKIAEMAATFEQMKTDMQTKMQQHEEALADITEGVLLWKNPDPEAEFRAMRIEMDLSAYKKIVVFFGGEERTIRRKDEIHRISICEQTGDSVVASHARNITWKDDYIHISNILSEASDATDIVPTMIIGYKSGGFISTSDDGGNEDGGFDL